MRHTFPHKQSFLNPQVLTHAVIVADEKPKPSYSPITSDNDDDKDVEEFAPSNMVRNVKQEPVNLIKEAPEV